MTVALPGYPRPNTTEVKGFRIEVGSPDAMSWRPLGAYMAGTTFEWDWAIPTTAEIYIRGDHPMASYLSHPRRKSHPHPHHPQWNPVGWAGYGGSSRGDRLAG